ncbi:MAG: hypothetical protein Q8O15_10415, partial [Rectinemataceae bacterium]|nr:hypothetical protein [Rectinemataceae bacterium]
WQAGFRDEGARHTVVKKSIHEARTAECPCSITIGRILFNGIAQLVAVPGRTVDKTLSNDGL